MINTADKERLAFLIRVTKKELSHLKYSQAQIFSQTFTIERAQSLENNPELAEKVEAFVSRFCRFQDTLGDKLLPLFLKLLGEPIGPVIDNLVKAEKLGLLDSADDWLSYRQLRNQMVHEYIEDEAVFVDAIQQSNQIVPLFEKVLISLLEEVKKREFV